VLVAPGHLMFGFVEALVNVSPVRDVPPLIDVSASVISVLQIVGTV